MIQGAGCMLLFGNDYYLAAILLILLTVNPLGPDNLVLVQPYLTVGFTLRQFFLFSMQKPEGPIRPF